MCEDQIVATLTTLGDDGVLPSPELVDYYTRLQDREILLNDVCTDALVDWAWQIMKWNREDDIAQAQISAAIRNPIRIYINSDGGDLPATLNLIDVIRLSKTPVYTIGMSRCYSSGGLLLMSGHKRFIFPNTTFLLHDGYSGGSNSIGKLMDTLAFTRTSEDKVRDYVCGVSKITPEIYDANYRKDWFMHSDEMIELGVADHIVTDLSELS